ncbi:MAG: hypothetical protein KF681_16015 [Bdellovibrionaceae bacterium]|nr:hypothetical protein [Pseudobdellovibrionaceae bacterium]
MTSKVCSGCRIMKGLQKFHVQARGLHGRESRCKECVGMRKGRRQGQQRRRRSDDYIFKSDTVGLPSPESLQDVAFSMAETLKGVLDDEKF